MAHKTVPTSDSVSISIAFLTHISWEIALLSRAVQQTIRQMGHANANHSGGNPEHPLINPHQLNQT